GKFPEESRLEIDAVGLGSSFKRQPMLASPHALQSFRLVVSQEAIVIFICRVEISAAVNFYTLWAGKATSRRCGRVAGEIGLSNHRVSGRVAQRLVDYQQAIIVAVADNQLTETTQRDAIRMTDAGSIYIASHCRKIRLTIHQIRFDISRSRMQGVVVLEHPTVSLRGDPEIVR